MATLWPNLMQIGQRTFENTHLGILAPLKTDEKAFLNPRCPELAGVGIEKKRKKRRKTAIVISVTL